MKRLSILFLFVFLSIDVFAQTDSSQMNIDANYSRPFLIKDNTPVALGGYIEANTQYEGTDGIPEGFAFQFRRLTLFASSTISENLKFLTEIEFEDGTKEINIEYAALDIMFNSLLNLRGGIVMNPIGSFNQNHDGPKWDFIDRPIEPTALLGATLSNVGFGLYGKYFVSDLVFSYETYLTNGYDDHVIANDLNRTSLAAGKVNPEKFEESVSGLPMFSGKLAMKYRKIGEFGISYMNGVYNSWRIEGVEVDEKRSVSVLAFDLDVSLTSTTYLRGEAAFVSVDVPDSYSQQFGEKQYGGYIDIVQTVFQGEILSFKDAKLNLCVRGEYVDFNSGTFNETGGNISDDITSFTGALSLRLTGSTVIKANYRYSIIQDLLGNPPAHNSALQFGLATYF
ncbi:MAG TPA: hypothetical protein VIX80_06060 [Candidatus Kapabacteria bacterium]